MPGLGRYTFMVLGVAAAAAAGALSAKPDPGSAAWTVDEQIAAYQTLSDKIEHEEAGYAQAAAQIGKPEEITVFAAGSEDELDSLIGTINVNISHFDAIHELYTVYGPGYQRLLEGNPDLQDLASDVARVGAARTADADQAHALWQEILSYAQEAKSLGEEDHERRETVFGHMNDDNRASRKLEADMAALTSQVDQDMGQATVRLRDLIRARNSLPASAGMQEMPDVDGITFQTAYVKGHGTLKTAAGETSLGALAPGTHVDGVAQLDVGDIGQAVLRLSDRSQIILAPATSAQLDYFEFAASGRLKSGTITILKGGFHWTGGPDQGIAAELTLIVPAGQIMFRGREFTVTVNPDGSGDVLLRDGDMEITEKTPPENVAKHGHHPKNGRIHLATNSRIWFKADGTWGPPFALGM